MPNVLVQLVMLATIVLLIASIWLIWGIRHILQSGKLRAAWVGLGCILLSAVLGCALFLHTNDIEGANHHEDWLVASTLCAASLFIVGVCAISLGTARDLSRIGDLERKAFFDPLTNLYTRGHIDSLLNVECKRNRAETNQLSVLLLDIDDFKFINDCFGHHAGDYVLKEIGRVLRLTFPAPCLVGRYGGEEFLVVLPRTAPYIAEESAAKLLAQIRATHFETGRGVFPVTVSIGVTTTKTFHETPGDLVRTADNAMYAAKRRGRNQVVVAAEQDLQLDEVRMQAKVRTARQNG